MPQQKRYWIKSNKTNHALPLWQPSTGQADPRPKWPGDIYSAKIDWDLTDKEITDRFSRAIRLLRPSSHKPVNVLTETEMDQLTAIAAQRIIDCRGAITPMAFSMKFGAKDSIRDALFTKKKYIDAAAVRYARTEREFGIGFTNTGELRLDINRAAYSRTKV